MTVCPLERTDCPLTPKPKPVTFDVVVASLNVNKALTTERALADVYEVIGWPTAPDVILLQEVQARDSIFASFNRNSRYWTTHHMGREHAIMFRKDRFKSTAHDAVLMCVGKSNQPNRYLAWDDLTHIETGAEVTFGSWHAPPSIETNGRPRLTNPWGVARMKEHMVRLESYTEAKTLHRPFIGGGDLNVDYRKDAKAQTTYFPYASFERAGLIPSYRALGVPSGGTLGNRLVDWMAHAPSSAPGAAQIVPVSHGIMRDFHTDHHGVLVRYRVTAGAR